MAGGWFSVGMVPPEEGPSPKPSALEPGMKSLPLVKEGAEAEGWLGVVVATEEPATVVVGVAAFTSTGAKVDR
jgi:hypothetical protein